MIPNRRVLALAALMAVPPSVQAQMLRGHVPQAVVSSRSMGHVHSSTRMDLVIGLPLRNHDELDEFIRQVTDPESPNYRQYLTPEEFTSRFGPAAEDYQKLAEFLRAQGLEITATHPNRMILDVSGSVAAIERIFHVNLLHWHHATRGAYFAPDREPSLDAGINILDVSGLDNFTIPRPMDVQSLPWSEALPLTTGSGRAGLFIGNDFRAAYAPGVTLNGSGQVVGLFELDGFYAADVAANFKEAGLTPVPVEPVLLDGFSGAPGKANIEVTLDIMMAAYMAPGLSKIIVYEGKVPNDVLNRMATDNQAKQLSSSWGFSPANATTEQIFKQMIAQGQSMFQASGDSGAYTGWIMPPSDDPYVTVVGGTSLTTATAGGAWKSEATWPGSGGGVSTVWPIPIWQQAVNLTSAGGSSTMRNIPDVAMISDTQIFLIQNNGQAVCVGGTSAAAPLWAGFMALVNQQAAAQRNPSVGFLNPSIYKIGAGTNRDKDLHDITAGSNKGFNAVPGNDLATGWGSPAGQTLIDDLTGLAAAPSFTMSISAPSVSVKAGASATATITINPQNGFSGTVGLAVTGLPSGVTASFSPTSTTSTSTLTLTASSSAASGTSTLTITGTSGSLTGAAPLTLAVAATPEFGLTAASSSITVVQGSSSTSVITVTPRNGFTGSVALAASGLPAGMTASFSPASTAGTSTLTLSAGSSAGLGTAAITITGTSGSLRGTVVISLTVTGALGFTLAASPDRLNVFLGSSGTSTIAVTPKNGFKGIVTLAVSGLPSGVTASFNGANTGSASTLTLTASGTAMPGTTTVTVAGTSGNLRAAAAIALTVALKPNFTLTASPASLSITQGASKTTTIAVTPVNGFDSVVALTVAGLPKGVTAAFSTVSTSHTSILTFNVAANAAPGSATVAVSGIAGAITSKTSIALTIAAAPGFTLAASPHCLEHRRGWERHHHDRHPSSKRVQWQSQPRCQRFAGGPDRCVRLRDGHDQRRSDSEGIQCASQWDRDRRGDGHIRRYYR
jgi:subtilase family serine protease